MATGTAAASAAATSLRRFTTYASASPSPTMATTVTVGWLPAGASVIGGGVHIVTAFNSSGTDLVDIGYVGATTVAAAYASALTLAAVGFIVLDELATTTNIQGTVEHNRYVHPDPGRCRCDRRRRRRDHHVRRQQRQLRHVRGASASLLHKENSHGHRHQF
jgi:hypothetical protein